MKKVMKYLTVFVMVAAMVMPQVAYAGWGNGRGKGGDDGDFDGWMPPGIAKKNGQ